jgi:HEAT repeat protein
MALFGIFGPPNVNKLKAKGDIKRLISALYYRKDSAIWQKAAIALGEIGSPAIEPLIEIIQDPYSNEYPEGVLRALEEIGAPAVEHLRNLIAKNRSRYIYGRIYTEHYVRMNLAAIKVLRRIGNEEAIKCLIANLDLDLSLDLEVEKMLKALGSSVIEPLINAINNGSKRAAEMLIEIEGERAVDPLIAVLLMKSDDLAHSYVRAYAAKMLGEIGDERAVEPLIAALEDCINVGEQAAKALGKIGDERAFKPLIATFSDTNACAKNVTLNAAEALGKIGDERVVEPLITLLAETRYWFQELGKRTQFSVAQEALMALGSFAVEPSIEILLKSKNNDMRWAAMIALGSIRDKRAIEPLEAAIKNGDLGKAERTAEVALRSIRGEKGNFPLWVPIETF